MDEFAKKFGHSCDTENREDKINFILCVANVVRLSNSQETNPFYTKDLFSIYGNSKDFNVGSNFFSTNSVSASKNSENPIPFPSRFPALLECKKRCIGVVNEAYDSFANSTDYLGADDNKYALLFLWLSRFSNVTEKSSAYSDFLAQLKNSYSQNAIDSLKWESETVKKKINEFLAILDFEDNPVFLKQKDLIFDELNEDQVKKVFSLYLVIHCTAQRADFKPHCVDVCESWLDKRLPNNEIGNLFRYVNPAGYKKEYKRIKQINGFNQINENDQSGRPVTALNHYDKFLDDMPHKDGCSPWQQDLEDYACERKLQIVVDSNGTRVIILNGCIIALDDDTLFACFYNDRFDLYREKIELTIKTKNKWHLCNAEETIPNKPYSNAKTKEILDSEEDICLYVKLTDDSIFKNDIGELVEIISEAKPTQSFDPFTSSQIIYYGVPGSGKSFEIDSKINSKVKSKKEREWRVSRVVFHPDYTNADFVGQILPVVIPGERVSYKFTPGPFAKILRRAYLNPNKDFFLIIEEINRGNASAIFGDLFQLLDRIEPGKEPKEPGFGENEYCAGWSNYSIENQNICDYIRNIKTFESEKQDGSEDPQHDPCIETKKAELDGATSFGMLAVTLRTGKKLIISENTQIRLPPNLSIYATMNTSDQNVFTLDNAFQRRWEMKQVPNELKDSGESADQYEQTIKMVRKSETGEETVDTNVQWGDFRKAINEVIMDSAQANGLSSMEDKRLGGWFFTPSDNFAEKVLKYLWDDAFKFDRKTQFGEIKTLEELVEKFNKDGFKVFKDERISKLQKDASVTPEGSSQNDSPDVND
ncbi:MAG: AAA family ATPase [Treponema sp.]|nr:AAA family ATPase [Treponema sp.]